MQLDKLQYISQGETPQEQIHNITKALEGGVKWIQLRFKNADDSLLADTAEKAKKLCQKHSAILIINDRVDIAAQVSADGVHLGLEDMPVAMAKKILGKNKIIGGTANTLSDVLKRITEGCTYIGLGPFRFTTTKEKLSPILGIKGYQEIISEVTQQGKNIPIIAIGGITEDDINDIINTGAYGIAISGLITHARNTSYLIKNINKKLWKNSK